MIRQRHGCCLVALLIATVATAVSPTFGNEIRIWPTAFVRGESVTIGDVAELRGHDPVSMRRLSKLEVGFAPRYGGEILVRADDVRGALTKADVDLGAIRIFGSSRCKVSRPRPLRKTSQAPKAKKQKPVRQKPKPVLKKKTVSAATLESELREYIAAWLPYVDGRLEIRFSPVPENGLALKRPEYDFNIRPQSRRKLGLISFVVDVRKKGEASRKIPVAAEVLLLEDVVVARRPINQGAIIAARDLKLERRRFDRADSIGLTDLSAAVGLRSRLFFRAGDMLDAEALEARPLIRRGEFVKILIRGDGLEIRTTGKAQQAGGVGDVITIRRDGAKRKQDLIEAVVSGPGLVTYQSAQQLVRR